MMYVLLVAAAYNLAGAFVMWFQRPAPISSSPASVPNDYMQYRLFTGGTALVFSAMYLYVFLQPQFAVPLLLFGIALKSWSFVSAIICYRKFGFPKAEFLKTGVANLLFALLFSAYLITII